MQIYNKNADEALTEFYEAVKYWYLSKTEMEILEELKEKSEETYWHSVKVSKLSAALGICCGLPFAVLKRVFLGGLLHDVGKVKVSSAILNKEGKLSEEEMKEMRRHSVYGEELLRNEAGENDKTILDIVRHHHEKLGGTGYPDGVWERALSVQIVSVADIYDALTSDRCYRKGYDTEQAFSILLHDGGINQKVVGRLRFLIGREKVTSIAFGNA